MDRENIPSGALIGIQFDFLTSKDVEKFSNFDIVEKGDVINSKLGLPNTSSQCTTCGSRDTRECDGHCGVIRSAATIFNPYFISEIVQILNHICPGCKSFRPSKIKDSIALESIEKSIEEKDAYHLLALGKTLKGVKKKLLLKILKSKLSLQRLKITSQALKLHGNYLRKFQKATKKWANVNKKPGCGYCSKSATDWYPTIRFKIVPDTNLGKKSVSIVAEIGDKLPRRFQNKTLYEVLPNDFWKFLTMLPHQQESNMKCIKLSPWQVFDMLKQVDREVIEHFVSSRDFLFLSNIPVTPNCHRLTETSYAYSVFPQLSYDERTKAYKRVADISRKLDRFHGHQQLGILAPSYTSIQVLDLLHTSKLRSNKSSIEDQPASRTGLKWLKDVVLSKRSDNSFRMVMVGDPKLKLSEIGVPSIIAERLFVAEHVNAYNIEKLKFNCNYYLLTKEELHTRNKGQLSPLRKSSQLQLGDTFYRPLESGDLVLVNRPPSVHQHSLIGLRVKILPNQSVVSINPLCCAPLMGDFDGDCLHGYIPQSIRCRVELRELLSLEHQLFNVQDGRDLLSLTHDSMTAAHLISATDVFLNKIEMQQLEMLCPFQMTLPAIIKDPTVRSPLWTGHQLFNMFKSSERKFLDNLFSVQNVLCEYLTMRGLTVSLADLYLSSDIYTRTKLMDETICGLEEAKQALHIKQLMLDPEMAFLLKCSDETEDSSQPMSYNFSMKRRQVNTVSIAAFKDVFNNLQNAICQHISKDNSVLTMINSGSKGSLPKLVQQSVCLGLQLSTIPLPFTVPHKLSCTEWNQQKALSCSINPQDVSKATGPHDVCSVISSSLLEGLNPLECFVHALSGRSNLFSENAELPGTLTRKLMFFMRDIYLSYDGTVRSVHGQQIANFSYNLMDDSSTKDDKSLEFSLADKKSNTIGGHPVGLLAAGSLSEAAYAALDHPMSSLEDSPLIYLKKVLEYGGSGASVDQTISLFLSKKLAKWNYGFEHKALEVKNLLERTYFSDVVETVKIIYAGREVRGAKCCPWILHFHVSKGRMIMKKLKANGIFRKLKRNIDSMRDKMEWCKAQKINFNFCKDCSFLDVEEEHVNTFCVTVSFETSETYIPLDTVRDIVIPFLLQTLVKGFLEFKKVDILCDKQFDCQEGLFLRVTSAEKCLPRKFWSALQNACIPVVDWIDWECSRPDSIRGIFSIFGIDTAWKYFVGSLKTATLDVGRTIRREHLLMAADCLSLTGEFCGLTSKGLKKQREQMSISSPFSQAFFSNPIDNFIKAAKQGSVDSLHGAIDAVAWGKEAALGSGGPFEIIYPEKVHQPRKLGSIYSTLERGNHLNKQIDEATHRRLFSHSPPQSKEKSRLCSGSESVPKTVGSFSDVVDLSNSLRNILHEYPIDQYLNDEHKSTVMDALAYHPKGDEKKGTGVQKIKIGRSSTHPGSRCFSLIREDGTVEDVSYRKCVIGAAKLVSPNCGSMVEKKLFGR